MLRAHARRQRQRILQVLLCGALVGSTAPGCHNGRGGPEDPSDLQHAIPAVDVRDADFAAAVHRVMRETNRTPERSALLAGTVRRQLSHAASSFRRGDAVRGANAVVGALYLVRDGEARDDMFDADGLFALEGAFRRFSALGDEGRALAVMTIQKGVLPPSSPRLRELTEHQAALSRWRADTAPQSDMQQLTVSQRIAVSQALLDPSEASLLAAQTAINAWVARAVEINLAYQRTRTAPRRAVIVDAYRALQLGSETMAAVFLRHGRAKEAVIALDDGAAGRVADGEFFARLQGAAEGDNAEDWRLLTKAFHRRALDDEEVKMDEQLLDAATWGLALEAYRRDPTSYRVAHALADHLGSHGIPEAAPLVLADALGLDPTTVSLNGVLTVISQLLQERHEIQDAATARRIYASSQSILTMADRARYRARVEPLVSRIRRVMARTELRAGSASGARRLMVEALQAKPTLSGYLELATLERQAGKLDVALNHARRVTKLPGRDAMPLRVAQAHLLAFEVLRDLGDRPGALGELGKGLALVLDTRGHGSVPHRVRAELLLTKILHSYGEREKIAEAIARAVSLTSGDHALLGEVVSSALEHAMVHKDVHAARAALQLGFKGHVSESEMVRAGVWLMLLELELGEAPDGKADRVLVDAVDGSGWWNVAARWARNVATDEDLRSASTHHPEKVRAEFYVAMRARAREHGRAPRAAQDKLRGVASDTMFWEREVELARALLAPRFSAAVPKTASLP